MPPEERIVVVEMAVVDDDAASVPHGWLLSLTDGTPFVYPRTWKIASPALSDTSTCSTNSRSRSDSLCTSTVPSGPW